jgi:hypothetical protein
MHAPHQYSLRELFLATLIVAVLCWFLFYLPQPLWAILLWMVALSALVSAIVYCERRARAFAIGCTPPVIWWTVATRGELYQFSVEVEWLVGFAVITAVSGCVSICVRSWAVRQKELPSEETTAEPDVRSSESGLVGAAVTGTPMAVEESLDDDVFRFIEGTKKYWTCPSCHNTFISLQPHPACPTCGSLSVVERPRSGKVRYGMSMVVKT